MGGRDRPGHDDLGYAANDHTALPVIATPRPRTSPAAAGLSSVRGFTIATASPGAWRRVLQSRWCSVVDVVYCFDRNYRQHFAASVASLVLNASQGAGAFRVHVITDTADQAIDDFTRRLADQFGIQINLVVLQDADLHSLAGLPTNSRYITHLSPAAYYRLLISRLLPASVERVLYLDCDTIVLGNLAGLVSRDMGGKAVLAVRDGEAESVRRAYNLAHYVNSGVMLLDLGKWRRLDYARKCLDQAVLGPHPLAYADQCCLNLALADDIGLLEPEWNHFVRSRAGAEDRSAVAPKILHYVGADKPWQAWYANPLGKAYWTYLDASPWPRVEPDTPVTVKQHYSLARKLAAEGRLAESVAAYDVIVRHLVSRQATPA